MIIILGLSRDNVISLHAFLRLYLNSFPNDKFYLDTSKLKEFADDNFKFDKKGRKGLKRVENTVGKGEIATVAQK